MSRPMARLGRLVPVVLAGISAFSAAGAAWAQSCSEDKARRAVEAAAEMIGRAGLEAAQKAVAAKDGRLSCGPYSVKVMDYGGRWLLDGDEPSNQGRTVASFNDGAATNFMMGILDAARKGGGAVSGFKTTDGDGEKRINKILYWADVPSRKLVVYGAFILD